MAADLAEAAAGRDLIPGDPEALEGLAERLSALGAGLSDAAGRLGTLDDCDWQGEASEAFRRTLGDQPGRYERAGGAFASATRALRGFADVLRSAQFDADRAIAVHREAEVLTERWGRQWAEHAAQVRRLASDPDPSVAATSASLPAPPARDPGEPGRTEAVARLDRAVSVLDDAARLTSTTLAAAAEGAPDAPGFWSSVWDGAGEFVGGLWDNTGGALIDTVGAVLDDPLGFAADAWDNLFDRVAVWNWDTFFEAWKGDVQDLVAWDQWAAGNWQRALGSIAGNLLLGFGAGKLASRILRRRGGGRDGDGEGGPSQPPPNLDAARDLLIEDSKPGFRLTRGNADQILRGPPGTTPEVAGSGVPGADVTFRDADGDVVLRREVKSIEGNANSFNRELSRAADQIGRDGEVWVQVPPGTDVEGFVRTFQRNRTDERLADYQDVSVVFRDPDGSDLGTYRVGERLR